MSTKNRRSEKSLVELKGKINGSHRQCLKALRASLPHARQTGIYLIEARSLVEGKWLVWVQENCDFSVSQAQRYIRIADNFGALLKKAEKPDELTMVEALRILSPKRARQDASESPIQASETEVKNKEADAEAIRFEADSPAQKFVQQQAEAIKRQVLRLAKKAKDDNGKTIDVVKAAIALLLQLRRAIQTTLVVKVTEPDEDEEVSHKPTNRLNGIPATVGR